MNKLEYIHEMRQIAQLAVIFKDAKGRREVLAEHALERAFNLLDIAVKHLPEDSQL